MDQSPGGRDHIASTFVAAWNSQNVSLLIRRLFAGIPPHDRGTVCALLVGYLQHSWRPMRVTPVEAVRDFEFLWRRAGVVLSEDVLRDLVACNDDPEEFINALTLVVEQMQREEVMETVRSAVWSWGSAKAASTITANGSQEVNDESEACSSSMPPQKRAKANLEEDKIPPLIPSSSDTTVPYRAVKNFLGPACTLNANSTAKEVEDFVIQELDKLLQPLRDGLDELSRRFGQPAAPPAIAPAAASAVTPEAPIVSKEADVNQRRKAYVWESGNVQPVPEDYTINRKMTLLAAWHFWHHGDGDIAPPYKYLFPSHVTENHVVNGRKRPKRPSEVRAFHRLQFVCQRLDEAAEIVSPDTPSVAELTSLYCTSEKVQAVIPQMHTKQNRVRRADELNWSYAYTVMKDEIKRNKEGVKQSNVEQYKNGQDRYVQQDIRSFFSVRNSERIIGKADSESNNIQLGSNSPCGRSRQSLSSQYDF